MSRRRRLAGVMLLAVAMAVPVGPAPATPPEPGPAAVIAAKKAMKPVNRLKVRFRGTPTPAALPIWIKGPKGFVRKLTNNRALKSVPRGRYRISSPDASVTISPRRLRMTKKSRKTVRVRFTAPAPSPTPAPVTGLSITAEGIHQIRLSWTKPADAASVVVRRTYGTEKATSVQSGVAVPLAAPTSAEALDSGLIPRTEYTYTVFTQDWRG